MRWLLPLVLSVAGCPAAQPPSLEDDTRVDTTRADSAAEVADTRPADTREADDLAEPEAEVLEPDAGDDVPEPDTEPDTTADTIADTEPDTTADSEPDTTVDTADTTPDTTPDTTADTRPDTSAGPSDLVFGVSVPRASSWWVEDGRIHRGDRIVRLRGINWFGLETADRALHGTWFGRTVESFLAELRTLGFDSLRIPVSPESINPGFVSSSWAADAYESGAATTGREHLERLVVAAAAADFTLLLDFHTCNPTQIGSLLPGRPDGCPGYDVTRWLADMTALAALAEGHEHVLGIDLTNEPHALTWAAWKSLAERGAEAVLRQNPRLLVFVEGVAGLSEFGDHYPFWGENLTTAGVDPPAIHPARLVFSPHTYGPGIAAQVYFTSADFPANMPSIWRTHFGHLAPRYAVVVGEFGGHYDDAHAQGEVAWNEAFVAYLSTLDRGRPTSFYYWAVNPNSGDTGGIYLDDWTTLVERRLLLLAPLLIP